LQPAQDSPDDYRVKTVPYNANDVVRIDAVVGLTTHIEIGEGEQYETHAFGDPEGWTLAHKGNHYFIKPTATNSDTNLVLITDRHVYNILLDFIGKWQSRDEAGRVVDHDIETPWTLKKATVQLKYTYPEEQRAMLAEQARQAEDKARVDEALSDTYRDTGANLAYTMSQGAESIRPQNVWDNHRFTFFKFPRGQALPNIYVMGPDGNETIADTHVEGDDNNIIVAHQVAQQWLIRSGDRVIGVVNNGYDPSEAAHFTGTASSQVRRVFKGESEGQR